LWSEYYRSRKSARSDQDPPNSWQTELPPPDAATGRLVQFHQFIADAGNRPTWVRIVTLVLESGDRWQVVSSSAASVIGV
jgi:hypothetical protein